MTDLSTFILSIGLSFTILGSLFGFRCFFQDQIKQYEAICAPGFINDILFKYLSKQKYNGMTGFILIAFGTIIQISVLFANIQTTAISAFYYLFILILPIIYIVISHIIKMTVNKHMLKTLLEISYSEYRKKKTGSREAIIELLSLPPEATDIDIEDATAKLSNKYNINIRESSPT